MRAFRHAARDVTVASAGWEWCGLAWPCLSPGQEWRAEAGSEERMVVPWSGGCTVTVTRGGARHEWVLQGRADGWAGPSDAVYVPPGWNLQVTAAHSAEVAVGSAVAPVGAAAPCFLAADEVVVEHRGEGAAARLIRHYAPRTPVPTHRLLLCEVLTPSGGWSSYPPHKHDEHTATERALEEIYAFRLRPAGAVGGFPCGYLHTGGGETGHVWTVADRDQICVPTGYHGPAMAPPDVEMYYLNVMAGPVADRQWLVTYHPSCG